MIDDLIRRGDAMKAICKARTRDVVSYYYADLFINALCRVPSADRPSEVIYGNEHNCMMTIFGECSYSETGCGDCAVVEKVRKALYADRPQGEWVNVKISISDDSSAECSLCGAVVHNNFSNVINFCPNCGAKMSKE